MVHLTLHLIPQEHIEALKRLTLMGYPSLMDHIHANTYSLTWEGGQNILREHTSFAVLVLQREYPLNTTTSLAMTITANQEILAKVGWVNGTWMTLSGMEQGVQLETAAAPTVDCRTSTGPSHVLPLTTLKSAFVLTSLDLMKTLDSKSSSCMSASPETLYTTLEEYIMCATFAKKYQLI